jgi:NADH:ubiquinone oxidoreductase subunit E
MQLQELPVEIISMICRYTGLEYYWDTKVSTRYNNVDFHSLRYTCKVCTSASICYPRTLRLLLCVGIECGPVDHSPRHKC